MSHGPSDGDEVKLDFTALLDVVFQLIMFFMMLANFTQDQATQDVQLPSAEAARPLNASETDVLYVNLKPYKRSEHEEKPAEDIEKLANKFRNEGDPMVIIIGKFPMPPIDARVWLNQMYKDRREEAIIKEKVANPTVKTLIIVRASEHMTCDQVYQIMDMCKTAGFRELRLRAKISQ